MTSEVVEALECVTQLWDLGLEEFVARSCHPAAEFARIGEEGGGSRKAVSPLKTTREDWREFARAALRNRCCLEWVFLRAVFLLVPIGASWFWTKGSY